MSNIQIEVSDIVMFLLGIVVALMGYIVKQHDDKLKDNETKSDEIIKAAHENKEEILKAIYDTRIYSANTFCKKEECPIISKEK